MQLHTHSPQKEEETETDYNYQELEKPKSGHRHRKKKLIPLDSQDSILHFSEEDDHQKTETKENLPDLIQDTNGFTDKSNSTDTVEDFSIPEGEISQKKFSLPNVLENHFRTEGLISETGVHKKKFSLPNDAFDGRRKVEDFVNEVIFTISEMGNGNSTDGVNKFKGIIKKTIICERDDKGNIVYRKRHEKPKNKVHFSDENITIEIPRPPLKYHDIVKEIVCYYCCFGFLFPNT